MINFTLEQNISALSVTGWQPTSVTINGRKFEQSIILTPEKVHEWPPASSMDLDQNGLAELLKYPADVYILGTGAQQRFPDTTLLLPFYRQGIGIEIMDSRAACQTFNVLVAEHRRPVAGIIVEPT